jgi:hypothetical protein
MPISNVIDLSENLPMRTAGDGLAYVVRMRRQLDRFGVAFPGKEGQRLPAEDESRIRRICDNLEADITKRIAAI